MRSLVDRSNRRMVEVLPLSERKDTYVLACRNCGNTAPVVAVVHHVRGEHDIFTCHDCHNQLGLARCVKIESHDLALWGSGFVLVRPVVTLAILKEYGI